MIQSTSIDSFVTQSYAKIPYPPELRNRVEKVASLWSKFKDLPLEVKQSIPYSNGSDGIGYEYKDGSGVKGDAKENFDVTITGREWLRKHAAKIQEPIILEFIEAAVSLITDLTPFVVDFAVQVENRANLPGFGELIAHSAKSFFLRYIHYLPGAEVGQEIASAHVDQSGITFHLYESRGGFERLDNAGVWQAEDFSGGETLVIPNVQMQYLSDGAIEAEPHRVVELGDSVEGRMAGVLFVQIDGVLKYNKKDFGRLQEKPAGFNRKPAMPNSEFRKMFK